MHIYIYVYTHTNFVWVHIYQASRNVSVPVRAQTLSSDRSRACHSCGMVVYVVFDLFVFVAVSIVFLWFSWLVFSSFLTALACAWFAHGLRRVCAWSCCSNI
jgi:hypothetical protein